MTLTLPEVRKIPRKWNYEFYGAIYNVADICGINEITFPQNNQIIWQHGWVPSYQNINPKLVVAYDDFSKEKLHLVARKDQEEYLLNQGYPKARAVGMPICYAPSQGVERMPNSLLVMPVHSLSYTEHQWKFDEYVEYINGIRGNFDHVVVCVHPACIDKGYWIKEFEQSGYEIAIGADSFDRNAHIRMRCLFESFEFVTTNSVGSHMVYASYFGSKASVAGPYMHYSREDRGRIKFYVDNPELVDLMMKFYSEEYLKQAYEFLFVEPHEAKELIEWGKDEIGHREVLSSNELKPLFGLDNYNQTVNKIESTSLNYFRKVKSGIKRGIKLK